MSDDLNCLGQTPAQAAEFDAMCQAHDDEVADAFRDIIVDTITLGQQEGVDRSIIVQVLRVCADLLEKESKS